MYVYSIAAYFNIKKRFFFDWKEKNDNKKIEDKIGIFKHARTENKLRDIKLMKNVNIFSKGRRRYTKGRKWTEVR